MSPRARSWCVRMALELTFRWCCRKKKKTQAREEEEEEEEAVDPDTGAFVWVASRALCPAS